MSADALPELRLPARTRCGAPRSTLVLPRAFPFARAPAREARRWETRLASPDRRDLTTLPPGKESAMRHFHTREDELVFSWRARSSCVPTRASKCFRPALCAGFPAVYGTRTISSNRTTALPATSRSATGIQRTGPKYPDDDLSQPERAARLCSPPSLVRPGDKTTTVRVTNIPPRSIETGAAEGRSRPRRVASVNIKAGSMCSLFLAERLTLLAAWSASLAVC